MLKLLATARAMLASKRAAAAVVVALSTPVLLGAAGFGVEAGLLEAKRAQLQNAADAAATAGRETLNPVLPTPQDGAIQSAVQYGNTNLSSSINPNDVEFLWLNLTPSGARYIQAPIADGFSTGFANAVRVTARITQPLIFGKLLGLPAVNLSRQAMAYKCSNNIEPESNVQGTITDPTEPAMYSSWASPGHPDRRRATTSSGITDIACRYSSSTRLTIMRCRGRRSSTTVQGCRSRPIAGAGRW